MERFIKEHEKEAYDLLLTIAKLPSPSNHEEKRAQFCCNWLKEQGAEGVYIDEALNVVYPAALRDNVDVYMAHTCCSKNVFKFRLFSTTNFKSKKTL